MGDRRNIVLEFEGADVALYTHWGGTEAPADLKTALVRGQSRWTDQPYLARIIFCAMVEADVTGETGYGIEAVKKGSTNYGEASGRDLYVNLELQSIRKVGDGGGAWTFEEFIELSEDQLLKI